MSQVVWEFWWKVSTISDQGERRERGGVCLGERKREGGGWGEEGRDW